MSDLRNRKGVGTLMMPIWPVISRMMSLYVLDDIVMDRDLEIEGARCSFMNRK